MDCVVYRLGTGIHLLQFRSVTLSSSGGDVSSLPRRLHGSLLGNHRRGASNISPLDIPARFRGERLQSVDAAGARVADQVHQPIEYRERNIGMVVSPRLFDPASREAALYCLSYFGRGGRVFAYGKNALFDVIRVGRNGMRWPTINFVE